MWTGGSWGEKGSGVHGVGDLATPPANPHPSLLLQANVASTTFVTVENLLADSRSIWKGFPSSRPWLLWPTTFPSPWNLTSHSTKLSVRTVVILIAASFFLPVILTLIYVHFTRRILTEWIVRPPSLIGILLINARRGEKKIVLPAQSSCSEIFWFIRR